MPSNYFTSNYLSGFLLANPSCGHFKIKKLSKIYTRSNYLSKWFKSLSLYLKTCSFTNVRLVKNAKFLFKICIFLSANSGFEFKNSGTYLPQIARLACNFSLISSQILVTKEIFCLKYCHSARFVLSFYHNLRWGVI